MKTFIFAFQIYFISRVYILLLIRLNDAKIQLYFKDTISKIFKKRVLDDQSESSIQLNLKKREIEEDPQIVFLSSNLNNILVCTILHGVNLSVDQLD